MPNGKKNGGDISDRLRILEKAVTALADAQRRKEAAVDEELMDIFRELKALKLFLTRSQPEFKRQFPEIQRKVK